MDPAGFAGPWCRCRRAVSDPFQAGAAAERKDTMTQTIAIPTREQAVDKTAIRPFKVATVPEEELVELRRRIGATRFPDRETVTDATQGVQL
jgi:hypothetical protein